MVPSWAGLAPTAALLLMRAAGEQGHARFRLSKDLMVQLMVDHTDNPVGLVIVLLTVALPAALLGALLLLLLLLPIARNRGEAGSGQVGFLHRRH